WRTARRARATARLVEARRLAIGASGPTATQPINHVSSTRATACPSDGPQGSQSLCPWASAVNLERRFVLNIAADAPIDPQSLLRPPAGGCHWVTAGGKVRKAIQGLN